jgi:hypothetical protein
VRTKRVWPSGKASAFQADIHGFESRHPLSTATKALRSLIELADLRASVAYCSLGPVAQRQSGRLITVWSQVRILPGPYLTQIIIHPELNVGVVFLSRLASNYSGRGIRPPVLCVFPDPLFRFTDTICVFALASYSIQYEIPVFPSLILQLICVKFQLSALNASAVLESYLRFC